MYQCELWKQRRQQVLPNASLHLLAATSARIVLLFIRRCQILLQHRHQGVHAVHLQRMLWKPEQFRHPRAVQQFLPLGCMHTRRRCLREFVLNFIFNDKLSRSIRTPTCRMSVTLHSPTAARPTLLARMTNSLETASAVVPRTWVR